MRGTADVGIGSSRIRPGYEFDATAVDEWMSAHVENYRGRARVNQFNGSQSNPTYRLDTAERTYVLRRKPRGALVKGRACN